MKYLASLVSQFKWNCYITLALQLTVLGLTCSICVKKEITPTNTKNKQIPSISLLWATGSGIEKVCVEEDTSDMFPNPTQISEENIQIYVSSLTGALDLVNPYRQDLTEKQRVHWIDSSIHSCSKRSKNHVRPF